MIRHDNMIILQVNTSTRQYIGTLDKHDKHIGRIILALDKTVQKYLG